MSVVWLYKIGLRYTYSTATLDSATLYALKKPRLSEGQLNLHGVKKLKRPTSDGHLSSDRILKPLKPNKKTKGHKHVNRGNRCTMWLYQILQLLGLKPKRHLEENYDLDIQILELQKHPWQVT